MTGPDPLAAAWARHDAGHPDPDDAGLYAAELTRAWQTHEQVRALVWPLARGVDGTLHAPCRDVDCAHGGNKPGHVRCLAARVLAALHNRNPADDERSTPPHVPTHLTNWGLRVLE